MLVPSVRTPPGEGEAWTPWPSLAVGRHGLPGGDAHHAPSPGLSCLLPSLVIANNMNFGDLAAISSRLKNSSSLSLENVKTHVSILQMDQQTRPGHILNPPDWRLVKDQWGSGDRRTSRRDDPAEGLCEAGPVWRTRAPSPETELRPLTALCTGQGRWRGQQVPRLL